MGASSRAQLPAKDFPAVTTSPSHRPARWPARRIAVSLAFLVNGFILGNWTPQVPLLADRLGLSEGRLGLLILVFGIGAVAAMPLVGAATARFGSRLPTLVLQALLAFALPLLVLAPTPWSAAAAILFFGMTMGGMDVAMNANAVQAERTLPSAMMSSCHGFWSIGGVLGATVGGPLIAGLGSVGQASVVALVTLLALWPIGLHLMEDKHVGLTAPAASDGEGDAATPAARAGSARLVAMALGVCALFSMVPEGATIDWSAIYVRQDLGADIATSGLAFAAFSATMALFRFLGDGIRDRLGAVRTIRLSLVFAMVGLVLIGFAGSFGAALVGFAVLGVGLANLVPIAFSAAGNIEGVKPGVAISIATSIGYSGILIAPSAIGVFAEHFGFSPVFLGLSLCLLVVFALSGLMRGADRPQPARAAPERETLAA
ncbi:MFS transporter [Aureimonas ureilytica]|uniref:MFS transporter n=1 Tax=Aureimonas ureilytica TaxID=401562 RepID=UPI00036D9811